MSVTINRDTWLGQIIAEKLEMRHDAIEAFDFETSETDSVLNYCIVYSKNHPKPSDKIEAEQEKKTWAICGLCGRRFLEDGEHKYHVRPPFASAGWNCPPTPRELESIAAMEKLGELLSKGDRFAKITFQTKTENWYVEIYKEPYEYIGGSSINGTKILPPAILALEVK